MPGSRNGKGRARADTEPAGYYKGEPSKMQIAMVEAEQACPFSFFLSFFLFKVLRHAC